MFYEIPPRAQKVPEFVDKESKNPFMSQIRQKPKGLRGPGHTRVEKMNPMLNYKPFEYMLGKRSNSAGELTKLKRQSRNGWRKTVCGTEGEMEGETPRERKPNPKTPRETQTQTTSTESTPRREVQRSLRDIEEFYISMWEQDPNMKRGGGIPEVTPNLSSAFDVELRYIALMQWKGIQIRGIPHPIVNVEHKKTLILDLDNTLIYTPHTLTTPIQDLHLQSIRRPYLHRFLSTVSKYFRLILYTASVREYATHVINSLGEDKKLFHSILARENCHQVVPGYYVKSLDLLPGIDPMSTLILDDKLLVWPYNLGNVVPLTPYKGSIYDQDLLVIVNYLLFLATTHFDVRYLNEIYFGSHNRFLALQHTSNSIQTN